MEKYTVSVTWGKSSCYYPDSTVPFCWDGTIHIDNGELVNLDQLEFRFMQWTQAHEVSNRIYERDWPIAEKRHDMDLGWISQVVPGSACTLEGIRFEAEGDNETIVTLNFAHLTVQFSFNELLEKEYLIFHTGKKYSGNDVEIFLGKDSRYRVSREKFLKEIRTSGKSGWLIMPDDFTDAPKYNLHSMYGAELLPGKSFFAKFPIENFVSDGYECKFRLQIAGAIGYKLYFDDLHGTSNIKYPSFAKMVLNETIFQPLANIKFNTTCDKEDFSQFSCTGSTTKQIMMNIF